MLHLGTFLGLGFWPRPLPADMPATGTVIEVDGECRTMTVQAECRTIVAPAECRTLTARPIC